MWTVLLLAAMLAACTSAPRRPVPVEDRGAMSAPRTAQPAPVTRPSVSGGGAPSSAAAGAPSAATGASAGAAPAAMPGAENAGKPGFYTVRPGDTLVRIGLDNGQNWRDIARWNRIDNPNVIEVGQVLRVAPPDAAVAGGSAGATTGATASAPAGAGVEVRPVTTPGGAAAGSSQGTASGAAQGSAAPGPVASAPTAPTPARPASAAKPADGEDELPWAWPAAGQVIAGFDEQRNKGLGLAGAAGDAVLAAADGRVVYAGSGLRGYGNLVIVKHNNTFLTAYAHNQTLLVREDQTVRRGQKIAEMGSTDADRVKLHFEIRRNGKPVDPARYLPPR
ncbi:MAG: peptidoglycan DD-metalloendopeptidase family protein [Burkholderiaceae bacterium]